MPGVAPEGLNVRQHMPAGRNTCNKSSESDIKHAGCMPEHCSALLLCVIQAHYHHPQSRKHHHGRQRQKHMPRPPPCHCYMQLYFTTHSPNARAAQPGGCIR
jgi:hypothetical protein